MFLRKIYIQNFRNIAEATVELDQRKTNIILGENRSGKTSFLEAINLLLTKKSFRTNSFKELILYSEPFCRVEGAFYSGAELVLKSRINRLGQKAEIDFKSSDDNTKTLSSWVKSVPSMFISSDVHTEISGSSQQRRKLFDWGVFHVEPTFFLAWSDFNRVLKHRNAHLRNYQKGKGLEAWDLLFCEYAEKVSKKRDEYLSHLSPIVRDVFGTLSRNRSIELTYLNGWSSKKSLADALKSSLDRDLNTGYTHYGAHRYEVNLAVNGKNCRQYSSRGEQKLVGYAIRIAQAILLGHTRPNGCIIMCDDLQSEFDTEISSRLFEYFETIPHQVVVTSLCGINSIKNPSEHKVFHMEHGQIK